MNKFLLTPLLLALTSAMAGAATVDLTLNSTKSNGSKLKAGSELGQGAAITTSSKSKIQLSLGNQGGTVRAGSQTDAVLSSENNLTLRKGILLTASGGKGITRQSLAVETPEIRSSVKGTMLVAYQPETFIKITCIEGRVSVKLKAALGEFVELRPGQMVIINPADKSLPESVEVDLKELAATSALLGGEFPPLGSESFIAAATSKQARLVSGGELAATNLRLGGAGPSVSLELGIEGQRREAVAAEAPSAPSAPPPRQEGGGAQSSEGHGEYIPPYHGTQDGYILDDTTRFDNSAITLSTPGFITIAGVRDDPEGTIYFFPAGRTNPSLYIRNAVVIPSSPFGTNYHVEGDLQIGGAEPADIRTTDFLSLLPDYLRVEESEINANGGLLLQASFDALVSGSNLASRGMIDIYGSEDLSILDSGVTGGSSVYIGADGPLRLVDSDVESRFLVSIGSGSGSSDVMLIRGSSILSTEGSIDIYSDGGHPDVNSIVVSGSTITSRGSSNGNPRSVLIGNDARSGGNLVGGIEISASLISASNDIAVLTGRTGTSDSGPITVDGSTLSSTAGSVNVVNQSNNGGRPGIVVRNTSQLLALASTGAVRLTTNGSQILVSDSTLAAGASSGEVTIDAMAGTLPHDTLVQLNDVTANARVIRARSYNSADRDALVITGGRFDAASFLKFYAEGASTLRFAGNVSLNTPVADLAGKIVQVDAGGAVTASGRVSVFSDDHRYNTSGFGTINPPQSGTNNPVTSRRFADRPGF